MAECIITTLSSPHLATQRYEAQLVFLPPNSFFSLPLGCLPPRWLLYFLFPNLQYQSVTELSPCPSSIFIQPLGESLQVSSFQYQL